MQTRSSIPPWAIRPITPEEVYAVVQQSLEQKKTAYQ